MDSISSFFFVFWQMQLYMSWYIIYFFWLYLYFLNILNFSSTPVLTSSIDVVFILSILYDFTMFQPHIEIQLQLSDTRPTSDIGTEFEIQWRFTMLLFIAYSADHFENFVVIGWVYFKLEHCKFWSNFECDRNIVSGTGVSAALPLWKIHILFPKGRHKASKDIYSVTSSKSVPDPHPQAVPSAHPGNGELDVLNPFLA